MAGFYRFLLLIAVSSSAHTQLASPIEASLFKEYWTNKWPGKALIADVTATATVKTPVGLILSIETGKYWRNGEGLIRQDDQHGISLLLDSREPNRKTIIDWRLKVIHQDEWPEETWFGSKPGLQTKAEQELPRFDEARPRTATRDYRRGNLADEIELQYVDYYQRHPLETRAPPQTTSLEGIKLTIYKLPYGNGTAEWWVSHDLGFVPVTKYVTEDAEFEQRYHNIQFEKPPGSLFKLPVEFPIRIVDRRSSSTSGSEDARCRAGYKLTDGLTGSRKKKAGFAKQTIIGCPEVE
jgi:hypothetical protein